MAEKKTWWKEAIVYQIYPRSFKDSNGDGVGDLNGISEKVPYLANLGIDAIWLNPIFKSPNDDNGYDVSDYCAIDEEMGTMQDFDNMLSICKQHGIKIIVDLVLNHSSDEHNWFIQSSSSRNSAYRDYYYWWPAENGEPPKRYSLFADDASAWRYSAATDSYYLHYFSKKQPDLNWDNPALRQEIYNIMHFWLQKGVAGFRLDAFPFIGKDITWPEMPSDYTHDHWLKYYGSSEKVHTYMHEMYTEVLSKYNEVYTVGEGGVIPFEKVLDYIAEERQELNTLYHDEVLSIWGRNTLLDKEYSIGKNNVKGIEQIIKKWDEGIADKSWNCFFWSNHDHSRTVSVFGNDSTEVLRTASAKMLQVCLLTQRATPYLYYGDEIGMTNIRFTSIEQYNDLQTRNRYKLALDKSPEEAAAYLLNEQELSRDNGRTPMQWNAGNNAGFTDGKPWLPVNKNAININVDAELKNPDSIFNFTKQLIALRKQYKDCLVYGKQEFISTENEKLICFTRRSDDIKLLILLSFSSVEEIVKEIPITEQVLASNYPTLSVVEGNFILQPYQAFISALQ
jgi:oligo-1,6-glucosidase